MPKRIVATPAAVGEAKLVAQPVGAKPPPFAVVTLFCVGTATSTVVAPTAPQSRPSLGEEVETLCN